ncbi:helix-turn-helix domain-containing protein [Neorhizobium alkalisoli]|uniref:hypothetical protein n=1 Tax=Neorhizobium alkalisoli TaxID=528178 RepID=UPI000CF9469E|nr:hypothetical protein [Neorhizobium alkalisoli]
MITPAQCRAARALVEISRETLAKLSDIDVSVVEAFEHRVEKPDPTTITRIQATLEMAGAVFLDESKDGGGVGVRLKFDGASTRRISILEGEGGIVGSDDVP